MTDASPYGVQDDRTPGRHYPKPNPANRLRDDAQRIAGAIDAIDGDVTGLVDLTERLDNASDNHEARVASIELQRRKERLRAALGLTSLG